MVSFWSGLIQWALSMYEGITLIKNIVKPKNPGYNLMINLSQLSPTLSQLYYLAHICN